MDAIQGPANQVEQNQVQGPTVQNPVQGPVNQNQAQVPAVQIPAQGPTQVGENIPVQPKQQPVPAGIVMPAP